MYYLSVYIQINAWILFCRVTGRIGNVFSIWLKHKPAI